MSFDLHTNFAYATVAIAPSPASSGTSLTVGAGLGALFANVPANATVWPVALNALSTNAEIVRVTARVGDVLTIARAQEGTSARTILVGDQLAITITAKTLTDIEVPVSYQLPAFAGHDLILSGFENIDWDGETALWIRDSNDAASDKTASLLIGGGSLKSGALITGIGGILPTVEITPYAEDGETNGVVDIQTGGGDTKLQLTDIGAAEGTILLQVPGASYTLRETPLVVPYVHAFAGGPVLFDSTVTATDVIPSGAVSFTPVAIAALHATPTAGMVQAVNNALGPVAGATVVAGGAAYAIVSYSGAAWFVVGTPD